MKPLFYRNKSFNDVKIEYVFEIERLEIQNLGRLLAISPGRVVKSEGFEICSSQTILGDVMKIGKQFSQ